jgi:mycothiol synthase
MAVQIAMLRPDLEDIPEVTLPAGYRLVTAAELDDPAPMWAQAINTSFGDTDWTPDQPRAEFMSQPQYDPTGVFFICHGDEPVATAFAWLDTLEERELGRVHWVGTVEAHRGQGLGKSVVSAVLRHHRAKGLTRAYLTTQAARLPAIRLYLRLRFEPWSRSDVEEQEWEGVREALKL